MFLPVIICQNGFVRINTPSFAQTTPINNDEKRVSFMKNANGNQSIGCKVTSCAHNHTGYDCALTKIDVMPCSNCNTGNPADESMCGSYDQK